MVRRSKLLEAARQRPSGLKFRELCALVEALGYRFDRQVGSHRIYYHPSRSDAPRINLQEGSSAEAKPYQVRQVLRVADELGLEVKE